MTNKIAKDYKLLGLFLRFTYKYKWRYLISFSLMPLIAYLNILGPSFVQKVIDIGIVNKDMAYIITTALAYLLVSLFIFISTIIQNIMLQHSGFHSLRDMRCSLIEHILSLSRRDYDSNPSGVYVSRTVSDVENIGETFLQGITYLITDCLTILAIFIYLFSQNIYLGIITFLFLSPLVYLLNWFRIKLRVIFGRIREINGELTSNVSESFSMIEELKSFNLTSLKSKSFNKLSDEYEKMALKSVKLDAWTYSILDGMLFIAIGLVLLPVTFSDYFTQEITTGLFAAYILLLQKLFLPLKEISGRFAILQSALAAMNKIYDIFKFPKVSSKGITNANMDNFSFKNVSFSYVEGSKVLNNITFELPKNHSLGIVGPSGSGKSTLIKLLMRHYKVQEGEIFANDININKLALSSFKNKIILIPQEPSIFSEDIIFNISLGRPSISFQQVVDVCNKLHINKFIEQLPEGYKTKLTNHGGQISTGQKQLIALARAFISEANTIAFDEATANIDSESEKLIQQALQVIMGSKTVITIAHRLSTIRNCNQIMVLQNGIITEQGSHKQLIDKQGFYYHLLQVQKNEN